MPGSSRLVLKQSHDPDRPLFGHVVQKRSKEQALLAYRLGKHDDTSKARLRAELAEALASTARG